VIDWEWAGTKPPEIGQPLQLEFDDAILKTKIVTLLDEDGDETDDPEMCYQVICEFLDGSGFTNVDFSFFLDNKAKPSKKAH